MLLRSSERRRLERGVLGGSRPVKTLRKFSTVTFNQQKADSTAQSESYAHHNALIHKTASKPRKKKKKAEHSHQ